jgi:hypothetical protein
MRVEPYRFILSFMSFMKPYAGRQAQWWSVAEPLRLTPLLGVAVARIASQFLTNDSP